MIKKLLMIFAISIFSISIANAKLLFDQGTYSGIRYSPKDFTATYESSTTLLLSGGDTANYVTSECISVIMFTPDANAFIYVPTENAFSYNTPTLEVAGAWFTSSAIYRVAFIETDIVIESGTITTVETVGKVTTVETVNLVDDITSLDLVDKVATIETIENVDNITSIDLIDKVTTLETVNTIESIINVISIDLVDKITTLETIENVDNITSIDLVDKVATIETIENVNNITSVDLVDVLTSITNIVQISGTVTVESITGTNEAQIVGFETMQVFPKTGYTTSPTTLTFDSTSKNFTIVNYENSNVLLVTIGSATAEVDPAIGSSREFNYQVALCKLGAKSGTVSAEVEVRL